MKKHKKLIIWGAVVVIVLVAAAVLYFSWSGNASSADFKGSQFTAVYLSTGDIYFGKMSWFPTPRMTNVWFLQRGVDAKNQPQYGFAPFKGVFWTPIDEINFNPKDIIFWTKVKDGSQLAQALANPTTFQPQGGQQQPVVGTSTAPSGFNGPSGAPPQQ